MICPHCGKTFEPYRPTQRYCSSKCRWSKNDIIQYRRPEVKARRARQYKVWYAKMRKEGKCVGCGDEAEGKSYCDICYDRVQSNGR